MKVAVVGPGAMGCLFAARISKAGMETILVDHRQDRALRLSSGGITVDAPDGSFTAKPRIVSTVPHNVDLAIILVKAYSTKNLGINSKTPVLSLQNGLGNIETLCSEVGSANVLAGVTSEASTLLSEGHVKHVATGVTKFGAWTSCSTAQAQQVLSKAGFRVEMTESPGQVIWEKVAINAGINPVTALIDAPNGRLLQLPEVRQLMRDLVVEAVKVASTEGYRFAQSMVEIAEQTCAQTADNISSMLQDIRAHKRTEIDQISGEILRRGLEAALPTPRTRVVWQLVKGLERR